MSSFVEFRSVVSEKSKMCQLIRGRGGHLIFRSARKKNNIGRGQCVLAACQFSAKFHSVVLENVTLTTDGRRTTRDHKSAFEH